VQTDGKTKARPLSPRPLVCLPQQRMGTYGYAIINLPDYAACAWSPSVVYSCRRGHTCLRTLGSCSRPSPRNIFPGPRCSSSRSGSCTVPRRIPCCPPRVSGGGLSASTHPAGALDKQDAKKCQKFRHDYLDVTQEAAQLPACCSAHHDSLREGVATHVTKPHRPFHSLKR